MSNADIHPHPLESASQPVRCGFGIIELGPQRGDSCAGFLVKVLDPVRYRL